MRKAKRTSPGKVGLFPAHTRVAVVSYNLDTTEYMTQDAVAVRQILLKCGYRAELVHQWRFNEPSAANFWTAAQWNKWDVIVVCGFYTAWNLRELILSQKPVICLNAGYVDDLGLAERSVEHASEGTFEVVAPAHPVLSFPGAPSGVFALGSPIWFDSVSVHNHHVEVLAKSMSGHPVLVAHKTRRLLYFGWYRMSQTTPATVLRKILCRAVAWAAS